MSQQRMGFGPWSSSLDNGTRLELSAFWRRRMAGLARLPLGRRMSRRWTAAGVFAALLVGATPLVELSSRAIADEEQAAVEKPSGKVEGEEFVWRFSNGLEVELIGLAKNPSKGEPWWRPDGKPLNDASLPAARYRSDGESWELAYRWRNVPGDPDQTRNWHTLPHYGGAGGGVTKKEPGGSILEVVGVSFDGDPKEIAVTFTASVSSTPWRTVFESDGRSPMSSGRVVKGQILSVAFAKAYEAKAGVAITVSYGIGADSGRVIAIDKAGREHLATRQTGVGSTHFIQTTFEFEKLTFDEIEQFELQTQSRAFETVKFANVSLEPGKPTTIESTLIEGEAIGLLQLGLQEPQWQGQAAIARRAPILGPVTSGAILDVGPPADRDVLRAYKKLHPETLRRLGLNGEEFVRQVDRIEKQRTGELVEEARVYPLIGPARQLHTYYHCMLHLKDGSQLALDVDYHRLHAIDQGREAAR